MKQDICWWCFGGRMEPKRLIAEAARLGYAGFELAPEEVWDEIKAAGLQIVSTGGHQSIPSGLNDKRNHSRIEEEIQKNLEKAVKYEIPVLICFSGNRAGRPDEEGIVNTIEGFKRVARYAEEKNVTLAIEILNSKVDHGDYQFDRMAWGVEVIKKVNSPRVKILYDIYHAQIMEGDLIRTIKNHHEHIAHYHTAGNPGRNEIDDSQEIHYPAVMKAIKETGYKGYVGQEFIPKGEPVASLKRAFELCSV
ncbi:MAG: TIM barrel protein [Fimbriimonadia bacterium]|nr:TIM barrel protein [Fimbriimonadia bacterium]